VTVVSWADVVVSGADVSAWPLVVARLVSAVCGEVSDEAATAVLR
jgi:hypothetical protein